MKKINITLLLFLASFSILSCGMFTGKGDAEKVAESLLNERIQDGGFGSDEYYSEIFWENTDLTKWETIKQLVFKTMGNLQGYSLNRWNIQTTAKTNELSGTFVVLLYDTEYDKGMGQEKITIHKGFGDEEFKILGHNFNSPQIQELIDKGIEYAAGE